MEPEKTRMVLAFTVVMGFLAAIAAFFILPIKGDASLLNMMLGLLGGGFGTTLGYYFNSSSGSKTKDQALIDIATTNAPTPRPAPVPAPPLERRQSVA